MFAGIYGEVATLLEEVGMYTGHTFAESTKAAYRTHLRTYLRFCLEFDLIIKSASQTTLLAYIVFLARTLKPSSINCYLNIIRIIHLEAGLDNPLEHNFAVTNLKKGIARLKGTPPVQKLPITCQILLQIKRQHYFCVAKDVVFWAACLIGFYGLLRKRTLLPVTLKNPGDSCLLRSDLTMNGDSSFVLNVRKTKTIQCGERVLVLPFVSCASSPLCPFAALSNLLIVAPINKNLPLFSYKRNGEICWWTHGSFTNRLKDLISRAGLDSTLYSGHSFRRGGATLGFEVGLSLEEIKHRGDWRSDAVSKYVVVRDVQKIARSMVTGTRLLIERNM